MLLKIFIVWTVIAIAIMCVYFSKIKCQDLTFWDIVICVVGIYFIPPLAIFAFCISLSKR